MQDDLRNEVTTRIIAIFFVLLACIAVLTGRLASIQILQYEKWEDLAEKQHQKVLVLHPKRGTIYDRHRKVLAMSVDTESIYAHPQSVENAPLLAQALAPVLQMDEVALREKLTSPKPFVWLQRKVSPQAASTMKQLIVGGVGLEQESKRYYPKRELAAQLLGFVGMDNQGLEGLEHLYNTYVNGESRQIILERDARGRNLPITESARYTLPRGFDLILTIDENIQYIAEKELAAQIMATKARSGILIVMDPHTGEILAMAEQPSFNPNSFGAYQPHKWRNKAVTDGFEPGSTFKVILAAAALQEGAVRPDELFYGEKGTFAVGGVTIRDHKPFTWLTFREVLEKSSNIGAIKIAQRLGEEQLYTYIRQFGFGQKTGIDLPGEIPGLIRHPKDWSKVSIGALALGQEILVTTMQLITAFSAIANGGVLMKPYVVKWVQEGEKSWKTFTPQVIQRVISPQVSRELRTILRGVVDQGTGRLAAVEGYTVAGKTGTAQKIDPRTKTYSHEKFVVSFVGFLPVDNPRVTILVMLDEPRGTEVWGGTLAAPVFSHVAQQVMQYLQVPAQNSQVVWIDPEKTSPLLSPKKDEENKELLWGSFGHLYRGIGQLMRTNWSNIMGIILPGSQSELVHQ